MTEPKLTGLSSEPGVILSGDVTTVIYRDADGTARAFQARADDPDFLAWQRNQRERPSATTVEVDGVSLEALAFVEKHIPKAGLVEHGARLLTPEAKAAIEMRGQNRHERRANAARGRRR